MLRCAGKLMLRAAEEDALYSMPGAADEPPPQAVYGEPRGPGHRGMDQIPLLATTGNDMSSKESVDMPMEAMTHPAVQKVLDSSVSFLQKVSCYLLLGMRCFRAMYNKGKIAPSQIAFARYPTAQYRCLGRV